MTQVPQRTGFSGPKLLRVLARLTETDAAGAVPSLSAVMSRWLGWTDAIALSAALNGSPPEVPSAAPARPGSERGIGDAAGTHVRAMLTAAITGQGMSSDSRRRMPTRTAAPDPAEADFAVHRQRYIALQQQMEREIAGLRGRLRAALASRTPQAARLAMLDAVMEQVLGAREQAVLAAVPGMLEPHFTRLRDAEGAWLNVFRRDMQSVLLAELEIRFQPVDALLAALREI
ncbi:DUF3348 domain-containing protein [Cupriavidus metallidurans]|mgnify:FL=1|uniref:DUF3348 domain-containing protein n=1 Tax=Cupriavidus metallidurans (strain ATCC 43123 / DSM 2839 / NBRC 102507 / CH34) TaxID=266264 RepID=Q1LD37_CUPMC|nr:DUF3348 domain-containing protein [Cupriavidus metallidurans]ABF11939.1 conserved hypothetical protein [Cupriavidus metallidurans CH34]QGS32784.1 DUF3348 family protein [Cupriavidus metallidurans]UBM08419.1 DUF3348 domain-containing protein [Cupriavidus metallidurans]